MLSLLQETMQEMPVTRQVEFEEMPEPVDFEFVLGRRQLASVLFVATVAVATCSAFSYLAGKSVAPAPKVIERVRTVTVPAPAPAPAAVPARFTSPALLPEAPVFADPKNGSMYLQMGAVEKGIAVIFVEGLRGRGFESFVAPGPNDHIFRVLIGPLDTPAKFDSVKQAVDKLGLSTFARKYQQP